MKAIALAIVFALCGDLVLNHHRYTSNALESISSLMRDSADEVSGSVFRA